MNGLIIEIDGTAYAFFDNAQPSLAPVFRQAARRLLRGGKTGLIRKPLLGDLVVDPRSGLDFARSVEVA